MDSFVEHEDIGFSGFRFSDGDSVTYSFVEEVFDFESENVTSSDSVVDTKGKKQEVSWF